MANFKENSKGHIKRQLQKKELNRVKGGNRRRWSRRFPGSLLAKAFSYTLKDENEESLQKRELEY